MTDNPEDVEAFMKSLETDFAVAELEKRALMTVAIAEVAGTVLRSAMASGVPYEMAKQMAEDYWNSEMVPVEVIQVASEEDE